MEDEAVRPSTSLGTSGEEMEQAEGGSRIKSGMTPDRGPGPATEGNARVAPGKHRRLQRADDGGRKLFDEEAQRDFLENFAASCNVRWAAGEAGFSDKTIYRHLMKDERFREGFGRALEQGYQRLQAELLAKAAGTAALPIDGDRDGPAGEIDVELALVLLREHARGLAGFSTGSKGKPGRAPRVASNAEVRKALEKGLRAFSARMGADESAALLEGPLHHPPSPDGPPPRPGEELE